MLQVKSVSNRLTYMARVMNIGKSIAKYCKDEPGADNFVERMQQMSEAVYERGVDVTEEQKNEIIHITKQAFYYKPGQIEFGFCLRVSFEKKGF